MLKKIAFLLITFLLMGQMFSQTQSLNGYKYVIVPTAYDFLKEPDQYQLNSLSKFLFEKYGFIAIMDDMAIPQELRSNICLALYADVIKKPGMVKTKLQIQLKNCQKEVVFISDIGLSKEKKYKVAYNLALREAFESFKTLNYQYEPVNVDATNESSSTQNESKTVTPNQALVETINSSIVFTAKLKNDGVFAYDLINENNQIIYTILFSGKEDVYIVKGENAIIYKMNGNWVIAKSKADNSLEVKSIQITF